MSKVLGEHFHSEGAAWTEIRMDRNIHRSEPPVKAALSVAQSEMGCFGEIEASGPEPRSKVG